MLRILLALPLLAAAACQTTPSTEGRILHVVGFDLQDEAQTADLVTACREALTRIPGVELLRCGARETLSDADYVDTESEVVLVVQFTDRAAHDAYQVHPLHVGILDLWMPRLKGVQVFDAQL